MVWWGSRSQYRIISTIWVGRCLGFRRKTKKDKGMVYVVRCLQGKRRKNRRKKEEKKRKKNRTGAAASPAIALGVSFLREY